MVLSLLPHPVAAAWASVVEAAAVEQPVAEETVVLATAVTGVVPGRTSV